jgi:hypothetical protein
MINKDLWLFCLAEAIGKDVHKNGRSSCTQFSTPEAIKILFPTNDERSKAISLYNQNYEEIGLPDRCPQ